MFSRFVKLKIIIWVLLILFCACDSDDDLQNCTSDQLLDTSRGACTETLPFNSQYDESTSGSIRTILANSIPNHMVGLFGSAQGSLNPNAISVQNETYQITTDPQVAGTLTSLF